MQKKKKITGGWAELESKLPRVYKSKTRAANKLFVQQLAEFIHTPNATRAQFGNYVDS